VFNFNAYPALYVFEDGKHKRYTGGREAKDIVNYMTAISKGLDPHDEELKQKPGLYKGNTSMLSYTLPFLMCVHRDGGL
jgi:hypothetical protein